MSTPRAELSGADDVNKRRETQKSSFRPGRVLQHETIVLDIGISIEKYNEGLDFQANMDSPINYLLVNIFLLRKSTIQKCGCSKMNQIHRGVTPIRPGWPLARGSEGLVVPKGPLERASVYVRDQDLFWPGGPSLGVTPLLVLFP